MEQERYHRGWETLKQVDGEVGEQVIANLANIAPDLGRFVVEFAFGDVISRPDLDLKAREIATVAALAALGNAVPQLKVHIHGMLNVGCTRQEVVELMIQMAVYSGFPSALNGIAAAKEVFRERDEKGLKETETVVHLGDHDTIVRDNHGDGPPIVLLHALSLDHHMWGDVYPHLAAVGRVITYDLRGHGRARGAPKATSLDQLANDTRMLLDILEIEQADVYGASYGGAIAQHIALNYPERVRSLAIIATFSKAPRELLESRAEAAERDGMEAQVGVSLMRWFFPATIAQNGWAVRYARECIRRARVEDWAAAWRTMARLDVFDKLGQLQMPTLVTGGKNDLSTTPDVMLEIAQAIPNATYKLIDPGTHMMILEQPAALSAELVAFRKYIDTMAPLW